eukprot:jgi/Chlat1/4953/Chrsp32S00377
MHVRARGGVLCALILVGILAVLAINTINTPNLSSIASNNNSHTAIRMPVPVEGDNVVVDDVVSKVDEVEGQSETGTGKAGLQVTLSEKGLLFAKKVLLTLLREKLIPINIPDISATAQSPIGSISFDLSSIQLYEFATSASNVTLTSDGAALEVAGMKASVAMGWAYSVHSKFLPVGDSGTADITAENISSGLKLSMTAHDGRLALNVTEDGTKVDDLKIELHGGQSWLYNLFVKLFGTQIKAAVAKGIDAGLLKAAEELNRFVAGLSNRIAVDSHAAVAVDIMEDPVFAPSYLSVSTKGEFVAVGKEEEREYDGPAPPVLPDGPLCGSSSSMVTIAVTDYVVNSALWVYYHADQLHWDVDELPHSFSLQLNTTAWKWIVPPLYREYPDAAMVLHVNATTLPEFRITAEEGIKATVDGEMLIQVVLPNNTLKGVAAVGLVVDLEGRARVVSTNITGSVHVDTLSLSLLWSDIGSFPMTLMQRAVQLIVNAVVIPRINQRLSTGFPLPRVPFVAFRESKITYRDRYLLVCTDLAYIG